KSELLQRMGIPDADQEKEREKSEAETPPGTQRIPESEKDVLHRERTWQAVAPRLLPFTPSRPGARRSRWSIPVPITNRASRVILFREMSASTDRETASTDRKSPSFRLFE